MVFTHLLPYQKTKYCFMNTLSNWKTPFLEAKFDIGWVQVRRDRIMNHSPDPRFLELLLQLITVATANNK